MGPFPHPSLITHYHSLFAVKGMTMNKNISLTGFMGAGKSSVAKELSDLTSFKIINLDEDIEKTAGINIKNIFSLYGEENFRDLESRELEKIKYCSNTIIDCGGGIILREANVEILRENSVVLWLKADRKTILNRLNKDTSRPLLNVKERERTIEEILDGRLPLYRKAAHIIISTDNKNPGEIAEIIIYKIKELYPDFFDIISI